MKKFKLFKAGEKVPSWMFNYKSETTLDEFNNRKGKITFGRSVIAVSDGVNHTKLMCASKGYAYVNVHGFNNASIGGVNGATGLHIRDDHLQDGFGKGLTYSMGNSGKPLRTLSDNIGA